MLSVPLYVHRTNCSWPPIRSPAHPMPWFYLQREPFGVSTKSIKTLIMLHYNTNMSMLLFECLKFLYTFLKWRYHVIPSKAQLVQCLDSIFSDNRSWRSCPTTSSSHIITKLSKTLIMFHTCPCLALNASRRTWSFCFTFELLNGCRSFFLVHWLHHHLLAQP